METHYRYTGQEHGPAGLPYYDYISRQFDPALGRFLGVDVHFFNYPSYSPYVYVGNNPIILVDPDGRDWYRNQETGKPAWYEGSGEREGYDHYGPNIWLRGEKHALYHKQNELVEIRPDARYFMRAVVGIKFNGSENWEDHGEISTVLGLSGAAASVVSSYHVLDGKFRGASGNYYTIEGRRGWNQHTGTRAHMERTIRIANQADAVGRRLGFLSYLHNTYQYGTNEISEVQYGFEMGSTTIGTFAPFPFNLAWTIGYEGLGRQGVTRIPWYQNTFKPWARNHMGLKTTTIRP